MPKSNKSSNLCYAADGWYSCRECGRMYHKDRFDEFDNVLADACDDCHITWHAGDRVRLTGETERYNGRDWLVAIILESHGEGKRIIIPTPEDVAKNVDRSRREWQDMQDGFRRLHARTTQASG